MTEEKKISVFVLVIDGVVPEGTNVLSLPPETFKIFIEMHVGEKDLSLSPEAFAEQILEPIGMQILARFGTRTHEPFSGPYPTKEAALEAAKGALGLKDPKVQ